MHTVSKWLNTRNMVKTTQKWRYSNSLSNKTTCPYFIFHKDRIELHIINQLQKKIQTVTKLLQKYRLNSYIKESSNNKKIPIVISKIKKCHVFSWVHKCKDRQTWVVTCELITQNWLDWTIQSICRSCVGLIIIFSVSFQFYQMSPNRLDNTSTPYRIFARTTKC